ncbi:MAG: ABC transporter ATP-binding protein, partial [Agathobacter sp.]|nr:ABC transporter ATP-binding protein [Agathobacter sp.]
EFLSILQEMQRKKGLTVIMSLHELELAARVSDKILCIRGEYVDRFGRPEEIFVPGYIADLFSIASGSFDEENGSMELEAPKEEAKVFVIAGGGTGRNVYRSLQREGIAFISGILFENDVDYPVAKALATEVIHAEGFEPMTEELVIRAKKVLDSCTRVICCRQSFGTLDMANSELLSYARQRGMKIDFVSGEKKKDRMESSRGRMK